MEKLDLQDEYIDLIEENKEKFSKKLFDIINNENDFKNSIGISNGEIQELEFNTANNEINVEKIIAPGKWKEKIFLLLFKAFENNLKIKLKAEPLRLYNNLSFQEAKNKLINFYGYFLFKLIDNFGNMNLI